MNCRWVSHYRPIKVPFRTSHLAEGQAGLTPWVEMPGQQRCRWGRHAGCEWAGQSRARTALPGPSPPSGPQAAPSLMPLGPRKRFLCPHDTPQSAGKRHRRLRRGRAREPHAPEAKIHGGERDNNSSPSKPSSPREPGWRKDSEGIWRGTYEEGRI